MCKIIAWWNRGFTTWRNTIPILAFSCMECKCFFSKCLVWSSWSYPIRRSIRSSSYVLDSVPVSLPRSPLPPSLHPPLFISLSLHPHHSHLCQPGPLALLPVLSSFKWNGFMALNHVELHSETLVDFLWILPREKYRGQCRSVSNNLLSSLFSKEWGRSIVHWEWNNIWLLFGLTSFLFMSVF